MDMDMEITERVGEGGKRATRNTEGAREGGGADRERDRDRDLCASMK